MAVPRPYQRSIQWSLATPTLDVFWWSKKIAGEVLNSYSKINTGRQAHFGRKTRGSDKRLWDWTGRRSISGFPCLPNSGHVLPNAKVPRPPRDKTTRGKLFYGSAHPTEEVKWSSNLQGLSISTQASLDLSPQPHGRKRLLQAPALLADLRKSKDSLERQRFG